MSATLPLHELIDDLIRQRYADSDIHVAGWVLAIGEGDFDSPGNVGVDVVAPEHQGGLVTSGLIRELDDLSRGGWRQGDDE